MRVKRKILSLVLCLSVLSTIFPQTALAEEPQDTGLCEHHMEHTDECGYSEETEGTPCTHECTEESGCIVDGVTNCVHVHDDTCGYTEATSGSPCQYVCKICEVQELINALPDAANITADNAADIGGQLDAIYTSLLDMTEEETAQVDQTRYTDALAFYETVTAAANEPALLSDVSGDGYAFEDGVLTITSNAGLTNWKSDAGISLSAITDLVIQGSNITVPSNLFTGWSGLASLKISGSNIKIDSSAFSGCSGLITVKIGDGVVSIGSNAFSGCSSLDVLEISGSVKTIDYYAFYSCGTIQTVIFSGSTAPNMGYTDNFLSTTVNTVLVPKSYVDAVGDKFKNFSVTGYELDVSSGKLTITSNAGNETIYYPAEIEGILVNEPIVNAEVLGKLTPVTLSEFGSREIESWRYWNTTTPNNDNVVIVESKTPYSQSVMEQNLPRQIRVQLSDGTSKELRPVWSSNNPYPQNPTSDVYGTKYTYTATVQGYTFKGSAPSTSLQLKLPDVPAGYMTMTMEPLANKTIKMDGYIPKENFLNELPKEVVLTEKNDSATKHTVPVTWTCSNFSYVNDDSYEYIYFGWDYTFKATSSNPEYDLEILLGEAPTITLTAQQTMTEIRVPVSWTPQEQQDGTWALNSSEGYQVLIDGFEGVSCEMGDRRYVYVPDDELMKVTDKDGKNRYRLNMKLLGDNAENADPNLDQEYGYSTIEDYETYHEEGTHMSMYAAESYLTDAKKGEATFAVMLTIQSNGIKSLDIEDGFTFRSQNGSYTFSFKGNVGEGRNYEMSFVGDDTSNTFGYFGKKFFTVTPPEDNDRAWAVMLIPDTRLQRWEEQNKNGGVYIDTSWERSALVNFDLGWRFYYDSLFQNSDGDFAATYLSQNVTAVATELTLTPAASNPATVGKDSVTKLAVNADYQYKGISSQVKVWYQWYKCNADGSGETPIEGANSAVYTPETDSEGTAYYYVEAWFEPFEETNSYKDSDGNILQDYDPYGWASDTKSKSDIMSLTVGGESSSVTVEPKPSDGTVTYGDKILFLNITVNVAGEPIPQETGTVTIARVDNEGNELSVLGAMEDVSIGNPWSFEYDTSEKGLVVGKNKIRITFKGADGIASSSTEVEVTLRAKSVAAEVTDESITKVYDGTDAATVNLKIKDEEIISGDTVTVSAPNAKYVQRDVGKNLSIDPGTLTVSNPYYSVAAPSNITGSITQATLKAEEVNWTYTNSGIRNGSEQVLTDNLTYNGKAYVIGATIKGVKDEEIPLTVTGGENANTVTNVGNGRYTFEAAFSNEPDKLNYKFDQTPQKAVTFNKAKPDYTVPAGLTATYGEILANITLPTPENGTWSWEDGNNTSVGDVGDRQFTLVFTPTDTKNYKTVEEQVTISVAACELSAPSDLNWDGKKVTWSAVDNASGYSIQLYKDGRTYGQPIKIEGVSTVEHSFTITEAGSYVVAITTLGEGNYSNSDLEQSDAVVYFDVIIGADTNGSATVNVGNGEKASDVAMAGTDVTLMPTANTDYVFWKWDTGSTKLTIEQDETDPGKWSFTMPSENVTVTPKFEKIPDAPSVTAVTPDGNVYNSDTWTTQNNVTMTVSGENTASGIDYYEYSTDDGSNWTKLAPNAAGKGSLIITNDSQTTYIFRTVTRAGTVGDKSEPFVVKLDKTAPTAEININNDKWAKFLNKVTFGKFFKETVNVTITAGDACSGIKSVEYMLSADEFSAADEVDGSWTMLDAGIDGKYSFNIVPNNKGSVYVRVIDNAGSTTVINSDGVVVYTDAQKDTQNITFTKLSTTDVAFNVKLNGNTVKAITLEVSDEDGKITSETISSENYSVKDGTITLKADYLQSLAAGTYTVRVEYNPLGENYVEVEGNVAPASTTVDLKVQKADRNAPSGYNVSAETISGKADGTITGLSSEMEYRKDGDTDYAEVNGTELTSLASGVYYVRYAQTGDYNASDDARIEVKAGRKLKVTVPDNQTGYTMTADSDELDWHGNTKLTFTLSDGYSKTDDFAVTAAPGTMVQMQDNKDGTYTLSSIEDDVAISVAGVADITAPAAEIKIRNSSWKEFLNTVTFGHFFKKTTDVTITAEDVDTGSGVDTVEYLLSEKKFEYKEDVDGEWAGLTENNGIYTFSIEPDHKAFVYVRVTDKAGNITIINSAGIVVYTDAAQDTGSITFTKLSKADAFFKVKLNGNTVKSLALETTDEDGQTSSQPIDSENYTIGGSTITLKADYLQSLEAGKYTVRVEYNPLGESYVEDTDNEAPLSTTVELNIQRVAGTVTIDKDTGKIYDGTAVSPVYSTNNKDGEAVVEYKAKGADDAKYTTAAPRDFGDYTVRVTVKADEEGNYTEASAVQDFEIRKKELTVNVSVSDKQYDGLDTAQFDGTPELSGVVEEDEVTLINGEPSFSSVAVGENISIKLTDFSIDGEDAENYYLTQPEGITANIYNNYNAEQDTDYTVNSNEWLNTDFVITAMNGYSLSLTNTADGKWTDTLSASDETADGILEFYVRNNSTGAISTAASESYKIDKTAPTGEIKIGENGWKEFLNNITFGLFFKETQTVSIDSDDTLSGIATVEYASSETPLTLEEVKALTSWQKGESTDVTPEDGKRFIYYARITDNAGNVICLSTDGAEYDLTAPVINGISDGGTYCISAEFTVSENNLKEVQVDGSPAAAENGAYTLTPGEHTVKVVDKADNGTQIKVTVNEKHTPEEDDGDCTTAVKCSVCGEVTTQAQEQHDYTYTSNGDGTHTIGCTRCGYSSSENCSGGKADCTSQAVCDKCGQPYGDKDPANHTNLVKTEAKPATHLAEGNTEYWYCDGCNRYFSDEAGTQEISLADTVIPKLTEHTADGTGWHWDEDSHWYICECGEIIDKAGHTFEWVTDKEATETETGSKHEECTVCGYEKEAVEIPATGTQDEPAEPSEPIEPGEPTEPDKPANPAEPAEPDQPSETPHATGDDKTESAETLQTGDDSNYILWIVLLAMSGVSITGTAIYRRKRKDN